MSTLTSSFQKRKAVILGGDQDIRKFGGREKSSKHRKAEEAIAQGQAIRIISERDFKTLVDPRD